MLKNKLKHSSICPLCGNKNREIIQIFNSENTAKHIYGNVTNELSISLANQVEKLWKSNTCYFIKCNTCSFSYAEPFIAGDSLFYQQIYYNSSGYYKWTWEFETTYKKIQQLGRNIFNQSPTLLEIGAGNGYFVKQLSKIPIISENILTTEFSSFGKSEIEKLGIECINGELWSICSPENKEKFDFICMFQVLEHMEYLDKVFQALSFLIKKNGHLFIAVPNNYHREFFESLGYIEDVPPVHISRWNQICFKFAANKYNWSVVDYKIEPNNVFKNVSKYLMLKYSNLKIVGKINRIPNRIIRNITRMIIFTPAIIFNLGSIKVMINKNLGVSQWVDLQKN